MTAIPSLNETAYEEIGPLYVSAQMRWGMFFDFASYSSAMIWMAMFGFPALKAAYLKYRERRKPENRDTVNHQYPDQLNVLMRSYKEVPLWWYMLLLAISLIIIITVVSATDLYAPWWTVFVAAATGAVVVVVCFPFHKSLNSANILAAPWMALRNIQLPTRTSPLASPSPH